jgi:hypothetical protein
MSPIPPRLLKDILADPYYKFCSREKDGNCKGRITLEHAIIFAGKQLQEKWSIIPLCAYHHAVDEFQDGGDLQKEKNVWIALNRATDKELLKVSKAVDYVRKREVLNNKYGT